MQKSSLVRKLLYAALPWNFARFGIFIPIWCIVSVGRHKEMEVFLEELVYVSEHTSQDTGVLLISGTGGMGKTKLLRAMKAKAAAMDFR